LCVSQYMGPVVYTNKSLDYIAHDEGRILNTANLAPPLNAVPYKYEYYIKDHLGSTRTVVDEFPYSIKKVPVVYAATSELNKATTEVQLFNNITTTRSARPLAADTNNVMAAKVGGANPVGQDITLKVMAGDTLVINTEGLFMAPTDASANQAVGSIVQTFINAFTSTPATLLTEAGTAASGTSMPMSLANAALSIQQSNADPNAPAAFLNYILYDDNMNMVAGGSGAIQISQASANSWQSLPTQTVSIPQNGFMRVFTSNTSLVDVRFDNLVISFYKGELLEEYNYYPYGLIFDQHQAFSGLPLTNYLYNGKELQQNEFGGNNGLELYDYGARMYDPQIGRWCGVDPMADKMRRHSPYNYGFDNPMRFVDADGMEPTEESGDDKTQPAVAATTAVRAPVVPAIDKNQPTSPVTFFDNVPGSVNPYAPWLVGTTTRNTPGIFDDDAVMGYIMTFMGLNAHPDHSGTEGLTDQGGFTGKVDKESIDDKETTPTPNIGAEKEHTPVILATDAGNMLKVKDSNYANAGDFGSGWGTRDSVDKHGKQIRATRQDEKNIKIWKTNH
jgi:RHS repeat-associated protein